LSLEYDHRGEELIIEAAANGAAKGSASALSGWSSEVVCELFKINRAAAHRSLASLYNHLLAGSVRGGRAYWMCRRVTAITKKDHLADGHTPSLRMLAISEPLFNILGRVVCLRYESSTREILEPVQLGQGTSDGAGIIVHAAQGVYDAMLFDRGKQLARVGGDLADDEESVLTPLEESSCILAVDLEKAYNSVDVNAIRTALLRNFPQITAFLDFTYGVGTPMRDHTGRHIATRTTGVLTGDTLSSFYFNMATIDVLKRAQITTGVSIMAIIDDIYLMGKIRSVADAYETLATGLGEMNLNVNSSKCELLRLDLTYDHQFPNTVKKSSEGFKMLSVPVGSSEYIRREIVEVFHLQQQTLKYNGSFPADVAFLLNSMITGARPNYWLRALHPSHTQEAILTMQDMLMGDLARIMRQQTLVKPIQTLLCLPTAMGGCGIRNLERVAVEAWMASFQHAHVFLMCKNRHFWRGFMQSHSSDRVAEAEHALQLVYEDLPYKPNEALSFIDCFQGAVYPSEQSKLDRYRTSVGFKVQRLEDLGHFDQADPGEGFGGGFRGSSSSSSSSRSSRDEHQSLSSQREPSAVVSGPTYTPAAEGMEEQDHGEERNPIPAWDSPDNSAAKRLLLQKDFAQSRNTGLHRSFVALMTRQSRGYEERGEKSAAEQTRGKLAHLLSQSDRGAGSWLQSGRSTLSMLRLSADDFIESLRQRSLLNIAGSSPDAQLECSCVRGGPESVVFGHAQSCSFSAGLRTTRHDALVREIADAWKSNFPTGHADIQGGQGSGTQYRHDRAVDLILRKPGDNRTIYIDVSVVMPNSSKALERGSDKKSAVAAELGEASKDQKHKEYIETHDGSNVFIPYVVESSGRNGKRARQFLDYMFGVSSSPTGVGPRTHIDEVNARKRQHFNKHIIVLMARSVARMNRSYRERARVAVVPRPTGDPTQTNAYHRQEGSRRSANHQTAGSVGGRLHSLVSRGSD